MGFKGEGEGKTHLQGVELGSHGAVGLVQKLLHLWFEWIHECFVVAGCHNTIHLAATAG